jgi:hypothetical protein
VPGEVVRQVQVPHFLVHDVRDAVGKLWRKRRGGKQMSPMQRASQKGSLYCRDEEFSSSFNSEYAKAICQGNLGETENTFLRKTDSTSRSEPLSVMM